mmetsp:Transcript_33229/g.61221  ORF Transcript_33229/g.61221 Transcript_33229/m.61221 type:complete len:101 (+) Transcript_33229:95-397(+)
MNPCWMSDPILHDVSIRPLSLPLWEVTPLVVRFLHYSMHHSLPLPHPFRTKDKHKWEDMSNTSDIPMGGASSCADGDKPFDVSSSLFLLQSIDVSSRSPM